MKKIPFLVLILFLAGPLAAEEFMSVGQTYQGFYNSRDVSISHSTVTLSSSTVHTINVDGYQEIVINPTTADYWFRIDGSTQNIATVGMKQSDNTVRNAIKAYGKDIAILLDSGESDETVAISILTP